MSAGTPHLPVAPDDRLVKRGQCFVLTIAAPIAIDQNVIGKRAMDGFGTVSWRQHNGALPHWRPVTMCARPVGLSLLYSTAGGREPKNWWNSKSFVEARLADAHCG